MDYKTLEPNTLSALGGTAPTFGGTSVSFYDTTSFIYTLLFISIVMAAFYGYMLAGIWRMEASESGIRKSNEKFKRVTLGLVGVFSLFLVIFTLNKDLLTGDVGLGALKAEKTAAVAGTGVTPVTTNTSNPTPAPTSSNYAARKASHDAVVKRLTPSNIHTNKNDQACTEAQFKESKPSCTSLAFMPEETIQLLLKLNALTSQVKQTLVSMQKVISKTYSI